MPWNEGAKAVADFIALDRECKHGFRSVIESINKMSQLEAAAEADPVFKQKIIDALAGTGKTIQDIAGEIDNYEATKTYIETNHPDVGS